MLPGQISRSFRRSAEGGQLRGEPVVVAFLLLEIGLDLREPPPQLIALCARRGQGLEGCVLLFQLILQSGDLCLENRNLLRCFRGPVLESSELRLGLSTLLSGIGQVFLGVIEFVMEAGNFGLRSRNSRFRTLQLGGQCFSLARKL